MPIINEVTILLVQHQLQKDAMGSYAENASQLYVLEARHTLFHVHRLLQNKHHPALAKTLENFLKTRWSCLKDTDAQYFYDTKNPANLMCIEIAKSLGRLQDKPYLPLLIPTLGTVPASAYLASSYEDEDLAFNELILSDDSTRMIHIPEVLAFSEEDGVLKHASLFNGKERDLSIAEESRLRARHPSVENYYHAIRDKLNFQLHGETAGAYLARLIAGLRSGGSHGSGSELQTGMEANTAITDFSIFLESLSRKKRKKLLSAGKFERWDSDTPEHRTLGRSWRFLTNPSQNEVEGEQTITYCVELIADTLEEILAETPMLYQLMPFEQEGVGTLASFKQAVTQCKSAMSNALSTSETHRYYGAVGDKKLALDVLTKVARDTSYRLMPDDIAYVARCYAEHRVELRASAWSILLRTRTYMTSRGVREALKGLPEQVARDVHERIFPNRHMFYAAEPQQRERLGPSEEQAKKKMKHIHFNT